MSSRKRKRARRGSPDYNTRGSEQSTPSQASTNTLFVQAYEATVIRDRSDIAQLLTSRDHGNGKGGLIKLQMDGLDSEQHQVWVDRYDARLLLPTLPRPTDTQNNAPARSSPTGWSDLPSDSEVTFFLSTEEIKDLQREKRRKILESGREERLLSLRESDPLQPVHDLEDDRLSWGGDDEKPDEGQRILMERTAKHLLSSPNPGQLEMRILANHGSDPRFAFLRGRWHNAWQVTRHIAKKEKKEGPPAQKLEPNPSAGGLVEYGDSDDEKEDVQDDNIMDGKIMIPNKVVDEAEKEARRVRAREWIQKRKSAKSK